LPPPRQFPSIPGSAELIPGSGKIFPGYAVTVIHLQAVELLDIFRGDPPFLGRGGEIPGYFPG
jgi:hypothetical protein